ncbi:MAG: Gfo/Idh/MocA family oxidoreductase [Planctomycetaceae bacterium]|nr:Gfo/Idh/MocA family oxidoreductase [Planctomycetaceae bacterium]
MSEVTRRSFLQTSAGAVAATSLLTGTARADVNSKIRVAVLGVNGRGKTHIKAIGEIEGADVVLLCDPDEQVLAKRAAEFEKKYGRKVETETDMRKVFDRDDIDVVTVATPNHWHSLATIWACQAGKDVYVEKPGSHNLFEGRKMIEAAKKYKRIVQHGVQLRSQPAIQEGVEHLRKGTIGDVYMARGLVFRWRPSIGHKPDEKAPSYLDWNLWQGPAPRQKYVDNLIHYNWHWFWKYGNGELGNNGVHSLDLCRWGLDAEYPTRVVSSGGRYAYDDDQQTPDTHVVAYEFDGGKQITWQGTSCNRHKNDFVTFFGSKGTLILGTSGGYRILDAKDKEIEKVDGNQGMSEHAQNFIDAIRNNEPLNLNAEIEIGHKSTLLCHLGNIAHRTGRTMTCDPANGHIQNDEDAMALWTREYEPGWEPKV